MIRYHLSRRQEKELAGGKLLEIALPHPPGDVGDDGSPEIERWYRAALSLPPWARATNVRAFRLTIDPIGARDNGLGAILGSLVHAADIDSTRWTIEIECVLGNICGRGEPRGRYPAQWPAAVEINGRIIPERGDHPKILDG